jgi:hypothetical protein
LPSSSSKHHRWVWDIARPSCWQPWVHPGWRCDQAPKNPRTQIHFLRSADRQPLEIHSSNLLAESFAWQLTF